MARKLKSTPFARFFLVMIILAPLAYIGASYYNGEDGIENFKNLIGLGDKKEVTISADTPSDNSEVTKLKNDLEYLERRVKELEKENRDLEDKLEKKEMEIKNLEQRVNVQ